MSQGEIGGALALAQERKSSAAHDWLKAGGSLMASVALFHSVLGLRPGEQEAFP